MTPRRPPAKRTARRTSGRSQLLEQCVDALHMIGFQVYDSQPQFRAATVIPDRYVIKGYGHLSLYGTKGRKEAFIHADGADWVVEAKWQETGGSVDEKLPYIWEAFLVSPVRHWIVVLDGRYWKTGRGVMAATWLSGRCPEPDRRFLVADRKQFIQFAKTEWGQS